MPIRGRGFRRRSRWRWRRGARCPGDTWGSRNLDWLCRGAVGAGTAAWRCRVGGVVERGKRRLIERWAKIDGLDGDRLGGVFSRAIDVVAWRMLLPGRFGNVGGPGEFHGVIGEDRGRRTFHVFAWQ